MFSLQFLFTLNSTKIPNPLAHKSPEIAEPNVKALFRYSSVITTDEAQLGIRPISPDKIGPRNVLATKNDDILSSPII